MLSLAASRSKKKWKRKCGWFHRLLLVAESIKLNTWKSSVSEFRKYGEPQGNFRMSQTCRLRCADKSGSAGQRKQCSADQSHRVATGSTISVFELLESHVTADTTGGVLPPSKSNWSEAIVLQPGVLLEIQMSQRRMGSSRLNGASSLCDLQSFVDFTGCCKEISSIWYRARFYGIRMYRSLF